MRTFFGPLQAATSFSEALSAFESEAVLALAPHAPPWYWERFWATQANLWWSCQCSLAHHGLVDLDQAHRPTSTSRRYDP